MSLEPVRAAPLPGLHPSPPSPGGASAAAGPAGHSPSVTPTGADELGLQTGKIVVAAAHHLRDAEREPLPRLDRVLPEHVAYVRSVVGRLHMSLNDGGEDVVQEVLTRAYRSRGSRLEVRALLSGIARHVVSSSRAKRRAEREALTRSAGADPAAAPDAEQRWQARQCREVVWTVIESLSSPFREVFLLSQIDGLAMPWVARALGIPVGTAYNRLHIARARFRKRLEHILARRGMERWELL